MSIRIIPQDQLEKGEKNTAEQVPPLLFPRLKNLYSRRAARLRELAAKNPLGDYLRFAAVIAQAQDIVLYDHPLQLDLRQRLAESAEQGKPPLDIHTYPRDAHWQRLLPPPLWLSPVKRTSLPSRRRRCRTPPRR